jgi:magnesium transporter
LIEARAIGDDPDTPASLLVEPSLLVVEPSQTVAGVVSRLQGQQGPTANHVAVCQAGRLLGVVRAAALLQAPADASLGSLAEPVSVTVTADESAERVAWLAGHADAGTVAVEDADGRFVGLVQTHTLLPLLVSEHELDLARLGGFFRNAGRARTASEEPVLRRVWHRAPWLLVGLAGVALAAKIVGAFEAELESTVALAFFLPGIVYMADAVGTQTETLVVRGLSVGISVRKMVLLETLTGAVVGAILAAAIFPVALIITGESEVAAVVSVSLLAASSVATIVAMALPVLIDRLGADPAFGSGPLATVVQDLLSIVIYFAVAVAIVGT